MGCNYFEGGVGGVGVSHTYGGGGTNIMKSRSIQCGWGSHRYARVACSLLLIGSELGSSPIELSCLTDCPAPVRAILFQSIRLLVVVGSLCTLYCLLQDSEFPPSTHMAPQGILVASLTCW